MSKDFTIDELYELIRFRENDFYCGYDELLLILAEYIDDKRITEEIEKYVDEFDKTMRGENICLREMKNLLEKHLTTIEIVKGTYTNGSKLKEKREKFLKLSKSLEELQW